MVVAGTPRSGGLGRIPTRVRIPAWDDLILTRVRIPADSNPGWDSNLVLQVGGTRLVDFSHPQGIPAELL